MECDPQCSPCKPSLEDIAWHWYYNTMIKMGWPLVGLPSFYTYKNTPWVDPSEVDLERLPLS